MTKPDFKTFEQWQSGLSDIAFSVADNLAELQWRMVLAESCTCGAVAAALGQSPGISQWLCGSLVTYRESAKLQWLGIDAETLATYSAESIETSQQMAQAALDRTSEASISAAVTGHLGPGVGEALDGWVFIAIAQREPADSTGNRETRFRLTSVDRATRQLEAAYLVLRSVLDCLLEQGSGNV